MKTKNFKLFKTLLSRSVLKNNIKSADLSGAKYNEYTYGICLCCPEEGSFTAFKKCDGKIVKLFIPEESKRSSATSLKCRASKAIVLDIEGGLNEVSSNYDSSFLYKKGETVEVENFDENRWNECSTGIHFFMNKEQARQYNQ